MKCNDMIGTIVVLLFLGFVLETKMFAESQNIQLYLR